MRAERLRRWHRKALRALSSRDFTAAQRACERLLEIEPNFAGADFVAAVCSLESGKPADAAGGFARATALDPERAEYWAQYARCLAELGRHADARACVERAAALPRRDALTLDTLGNVLTRLGRHAEAATQFEAAVGFQPDNPQFHYNLATALLFCGELARAAAAYERVLELDPDNARAHLALADMQDGAPSAERIARLEGALARAGGHVDQALILRQALAKSLEAGGDTAQAFTHWEQGKNAKKAELRYTIAEDNAIFSAFERAFATRDTLDQRPGEPSAAPVFVLGLPRSGTTLVERMLASHSAIASGGELLYFPFSVSEAGASRSRNLIDPEALPQALRQDPAAIGRRYLELARTVVGDAGRFIDKLPLNFFFIGFIRQALPNAKIVCLRRGALDTCFASFRQLFALNFAHYRYALSLADTAEYFARFETLMAHWDELFPNAICHVRYERLVSEPESECRRLLDYLGLEFEPAVLDFANNTTPVATASAVQVRRPLHRGSVGAWRRYARQLEPLRQCLEALGVEVGVEAEAADAAASGRAGGPAA